MFSIELTSPELASHLIMSDMKCTRLDPFKETDFVFIRTADGMQKKFTIFRRNFYFLKQFYCFKRIYLELSSKILPARITKSCTPASADNNKEKPPKDENDTRVSVHLTQTRQLKMRAGSHPVKRPI